MAKKTKKRVIGKKVVKKKINYKFLVLSVVAVLIVAALVYLGITIIGKPVAQLNDTVKVDYLGTLADGTVFDTSLEEIALANGINRTDFEPMEFVVGGGVLLPDFENAVIGMQIGQTKTIELSPDQAYGEVRNDLMIEVPREQKVDRYLNLTLADFKEVFGVDPVVDTTLDVPGLSWKIKVIGLDNDNVKAENVVSIGQNLQMPGADWFSSVEKVDSDKIYLRQNPNIGDFLMLPSGLNVLRGVVTNLGDVNFTVDMNNPLAGKALTFRITLVDLVEAE